MAKSKLSERMLPVRGSKQSHELLIELVAELKMAAEEGTVLHYAPVLDAYVSKRKAKQINKCFEEMLDEVLLRKLTTLEFLFVAARLWHFAKLETNMTMPIQARPYLPKLFDLAEEFGVAAADIAQIEIDHVVNPPPDD
jgi:hypothetical protein